MKNSAVGEKSAFQALWRWTKLGLISGGVIVFAVWFVFGEGGVAEAQDVRALYNKQQEQLSVQEAKKRELKSYLEAIERKDEAAWELAARRYGMVGPNEYVWKISPVPDRNLQP